MARPHRLRLLFALTAVVGASAAGLATPFVLRLGVDAAFSHRDARLLTLVTLALLAVFAVQTTLSVLRSFLLAFVGERLVADLRVRLFEHLQRLSLSFFGRHRTGELVSRVANDAPLVRGLVTNDLAAALSQVLMLGGAAILVVALDWRLTLLTLGLIPIVVLLAALLGRRLRDLSTSVQDQLATATTVLEEAVGGVRVVQSFSRESHEIGRFRGAVERSFGLAMRRVRLSALFSPVLSFAAFGVLALIFWFGGLEVISGRLTAGQLVMFLALAMTIATSVGALGALWTNLQEALGATSRVFEILDAAPEVRDAADAQPLPPIEGSIIFERVSFAYPGGEGRPALRDVTLAVQPGETLALVGPSGAGKSTLVSLLLRFYDPTSGRITVDGRDLRDVQLRSLRDQVGVVLQDALLFSCSVRENIRYSHPAATEDAIVAAAQAANAHDFILQLPADYDAIVGERGARLSGGQRQRLAIARAILRQPRLLVLDEATSSLDGESEDLVQQALDSVMRGRTTIVIAHRLSTIRRADRVAVLDRGRLVDVGRPDDLMSRNQFCARMLRSTTPSPGGFPLALPRNPRCDGEPDGAEERTRAC